MNEREVRINRMNQFSLLFSCLPLEKAPDKKASAGQINLSRSCRNGLIKGETMKDDTRLPLAEAVRTAYRQGEEDETLSPLVLTDARDRPVGRIARGDAVIFYNIRGEREIELTRSLTERDFKEFPVEEDLKLQFATMIEYRKGLPVRVAFPSDGTLEDTLS
ncbi:MAG: hypothetical protein ABIF87_00375, partial [Pseudomonadota bacterium]